MPPGGIEPDRLLPPLAGLDQLWVADITHIRPQEEFAYLAVVIDAFSRRVVGWALELHLRVELALAALAMAIAARAPTPAPWFTTPIAACNAPAAITAPCWLGTTFFPA